MTFRRIRSVGIVAVVFALSGCDATSIDSANPSPLPADTVTALLRLHGVEGRSLKDRPTSFRKAPVDRDALSHLFSDYATQDPFLADLYVGFVVGVLAENQHSLQISQAGAQARVQAGAVRISMQLRDNTWLISLFESIPDAVKARAKMEKLRVAATL